MALAEKDLLEILRLLERSPWEDLHLETASFTLTVSKRGRPLDAEPRADAPTPAASAEAPTAVGDGTATARVAVVSAPTLGHYRGAAEPGGAPLVRVGQMVGAADPVAIVEVLSDPKPVPAGVAGRVVALRASDGDLVEYGQDLVWIAPADAVEPQ